MIELQHFDKSEFRGWYDLMDEELLLKLDELRDRLGSPISISPAEGAIGRRMGSQKRSYHNLDFHQYVKAIDVMPATDDLTKVFRLAKAVGFGGIGIYPHWKPRHGLHLDVRPKQYKRRWFACVNNRTGKQEYTYI